MQKILITGFGFMGSLHVQVYKLLPEAKLVAVVDENRASAKQKLGALGLAWIAAEMIPPVPFCKYCPETLIHNTSRAIDAILALGSPTAS